MSTENQVSVQHSDNDKLVLAAYGYGQWRGKEKIAIRESRVINLLNWSSQGEGVMTVHGKGDIFYRTFCIDYPVPNMEPFAEWDMRFEVYGGTGDFKGARGLGNYNVKQGGEMFIQEMALIEGRLTF
jgi:hypothetical protein